MVVSPASRAVAPTGPSLLYIASANNGKAAAKLERMALLAAMALAAIGRYAWQICWVKARAREMSEGKIYRNEVCERRGEYEKHSSAEWNGCYNGNYPMNARVRRERKPKERCARDTVLNP
jgi:hypothetical protein